MIDKPKIAVTGSDRRGWPMWLANKLSVWLAGGRAVRVTPRDGQTLDWDQYDGLIVGGGDDIGAQLYGGSPELDIRVDPARDALELAAISAFLDTPKPILGICRGAQILNVALGGTLHSDIYAVYLDAPRMRTALPLKTVSLEVNSKLFNLMQRDEVRVNSLHHQAVDRIGDKLRVCARDKHGMVQAIEDPRRDVFRTGVQWHPEFLPYRRPHRAIFTAFLSAAREAQAAAPDADERTASDARGDQDVGHGSPADMALN